MGQDQNNLREAFLLHQQGKLVEAADIYQRLISRDPDNHAALHFLGAIKASRGELSEARRLIERSLQTKKPDISYIENYVAVLFQSGDYDKAADVCQKTIKHRGGTEALHYVLAVSLYKLNRLPEAIAAFDALLALNPNHLAANNEKASALAQLQRYDEALSYVERALRISPNPDAFINKGNILAEQRQFDASLLAYGQALALNAHLAAAWLGRGRALRRLHRHDEALAAYDKAFVLKPDAAEAWLGRGNVYYDRARHDEALAAYDRALALAPDLAEAWLGRGNALVDLKRHADAFAAYDKALALKPDAAEAWLGRGNAFTDLKRFDEALAAYDRALAIRPDLPGAWLGRGTVWQDRKRNAESLTAYDRALALDPRFAEAWLGRGNVFARLRRHEQAYEAYDKAFALKPDLTGVEGSRLHAKMQLCDWTHFDAECSHLIAAGKSNKANAAPFVIFGIPSSSDDQMKFAQLWVANKHPAAIKPLWPGERYQHERVRIAYISADFHDHPVSYLLAGVFERHDRSRFETTAISIGPDVASEMRTRLQGTFDRFVDAKDRSDADIAALLHTMQIDIAVDLMGHTQDARTGILALRPAPIQVNYLGYAGTMGASYIDYLIADPTLITSQDQKYYNEKVAYLPDSYLPNDDLKRTISERPFDRAEFGLPQDKFVFCCFNNAYKLNPKIFDIWMAILKRIDGSVLWLSEQNATAAANLRKEAKARGVDPERVIVAKRLASRADHLARHRLADLFLDTLPYNAHTTASDALWAGLPLLTQIGETFPARVSAGLLNAIGLSELIVRSQKEYEDLAVDLAASPAKLAALKTKLAQNRVAKPLFNTNVFTRHLEQAYLTMHERHQAGLPPGHFFVPA